MDDSIEQEFNACCEGRCPYFSSEGLVLDGSDGGQDHRMDLGDQSSIGTFYRNVDDNSISLVWGTHQQPKGQGRSFFESIPGTTVVDGVYQVAASLGKRLSVDRRTLVLRDYYPGWAAQRFHSKGGKPIFINLEDESFLSVMFDDHAQPQDPTIIDPIQLHEYPRRMPMAQVYGIHVVKATPLRSIAEITYFWDELRRCEKVARLLHDVEAIRRAIVLLGGAEGHDPYALQNAAEKTSLVHDARDTVAYHRWQETDVVKNCAPLLPDATDAPVEKLERHESAQRERERILSRTASKANPSN